MFKVTQKYKDFLGNDQEEVLRFNLTESEIRDLARYDETFRPDFLEKIKDDQDASAMYDVIRKMIAVSYGVLSDDAKHFRKSEEITRDFMESAVYQEFIDSLIMTDDTKRIQDFIVGIFPSKYAAELTKRINTAG